jgi:oligoendopeptidase F
VRALYSRYLAEGQGFPEKYLQMLSAGGSDWPVALVKPLGVDLADPGFWAQGLGLLEKMVLQAEELAE